MYETEQSNLTGGEKFAKAAAAWRVLKGTEEGLKYDQEAKAIPRIDPVHSDGNQHKQFVGHQISKLKEVVSSANCVYFIRILGKKHSNN